MRATQQNKCFRFAPFYLARDFYNRHEVAAQSGKTNGARISFEQLDSDLVVD